MTNPVSTTIPPMPPREPDSRRRLGRSDLLRHVLPLAVGIVVIGTFSQSANGQFLTAGNIQDIFGQIAVLGLLSVGSTLLLIAGQLDLSIGSSVSLFGVIAAELIHRGMPEPTVLVIVLGGAGLVGAFNGVVITFTKVEPFIFTLGMLSALAAAALIISNNAPVQSGLAFATLAISEVGPLPISAVIFLGTALVAWLVLRYTRLGRNAFLIGSNEEAAFLAGVAVGGTKIALYTISGVLAGAAAIMLIARLGSGDPQGAVGLELQAITAVVLGGATLAGGRGSVLGTVVGVLLLGVVRNALTLAGVASSWSTLVLGLILMVAVVWAALSARPRSFFRHQGRQNQPPDAAPIPVNRATVHD